MRRKSWYFALSCGAALLWLALSSVLALPWLRYVAGRLPGWYALLVIMGIALLPGYLMCAMFLSNLLHARPKPPADPYREPVTVLICARNEAMGIYRTIAQVAAQGYAGTLEILCVDNGSTDGTQEEIRRAMADLAGPERIIRLLTCEQKGKANALNAGLRQVHTRYLITVDADTLLDKNAVDRMLRRIHHSGAACVAGNLLVKDPANAVQKMQIYDYLISIAAIKRFQGSYGSTLVRRGHSAPMMRMPCGARAAGSSARERILCSPTGCWPRGVSPCMSPPPLAIRKFRIPWGRCAASASAGPGACLTACGLLPPGVSGLSSAAILRA